MKDLFTPKVVDEIKSIITTFISLIISFIAVDGFDILSMLWDGNLSKTTFIALAIAILRASIKALLVIIFPNLFKRG